MVSGQIFGVVLIATMNWLIDHSKLIWAMWMFAGAIGISAVLMCIFHGKLKRLQIEKESEAKINQ